MAIAIMSPRTPKTGKGGDGKLPPSEQRPKKQETSRVWRRLDEQRSNPPIQTSGGGKVIPLATALTTATRASTNAPGALEAKMEVGANLIIPKDESIIIREAREEDYKELASAYINAFAQYPTKQYWEENEVVALFEDRKKKGVILLAEKFEGGKKRIVGGVSGFSVKLQIPLFQKLPKEFKDSFYVDKMFIDTSCASEGIGKKIADQILQYASGNGFTSWVCRTAEKNDPIKHICKKYYGGSELPVTDLSKVRKKIDGLVREVEVNLLVIGGKI